VIVCQHGAVTTPTSLAWQGVAPHSLELAAVEILDDSLRARGSMIVMGPEPYSLTYELDTLADFVTARLAVSAWGPGWARSLELRRHSNGTWIADPGGRVTGLAAALDCDLGRCCLTNTMPVLRHGVHQRVGSVDFVMAWVSVPDLTVEVSPQRYTHLARTGGRGAVVRFQSDGFNAEIEFDGDGFVVDYPGLARRIR
jgi:hypothetical protein